VVAGGDTVLGQVSLQAWWVKLVVLLIAGLVAVGMTASPVLAVEPHRNPETAEQTFSGASLFRYYSGVLRSVLDREPGQVSAWLSLAPFVNAPTRAKESIDAFAAASKEVVHFLVRIEEDLARQKELMLQHRSDEVVRQGLHTCGTLLRTMDGVNRAVASVESAGYVLGVPRAPAGSELRQTYDSVVQTISEELSERLRSAAIALTGTMLEVLPEETVARLLEEHGIAIGPSFSADELSRVLEEWDISRASSLLESVASHLLEGPGLGVDFSSSLEMLGATLEELADAVDLSGALAGGSLVLTNLTVRLRPGSAFVGKTVRFEGQLTAEGDPVGGRQVEILLGGDPLMTVFTDTEGHYHGEFQVPPYYRPLLGVQAIYYPREEDIGRYLSCQSREIDLNVLYCPAELEIEVEKEAYPGLESRVTGKFDYGEYPAPEERALAVYVDDVPAGEFNVGEQFSCSFKVPAETDVGEHTLTLSVAGAGRYSPVAARVALNVARLSPVLELDVPTAVLAPGSLRVSGRVRSEAGLLAAPVVSVTFGDSEVSQTAAEDGSFDVRIGLGMGLDLMGSQELAVAVVPREPWHSLLVVHRDIVRVNVVSCGVALVLLGLLIVLVPRWLRGRTLTRRVAAGQRLDVSRHREQESPAPAVLPAVTEEGGSPLERVFRWYRLVVLLVERVSGFFMGSHQTLREFARESGRTLGPASAYFLEFTGMVERLLYSRQRATEEDAEKSRQLSQSIQEGLRGDGT